MKKHVFGRLLCVGLAAALTAMAGAQDSPHAASMAEMPEEAPAGSDAAERAALEAKGQLFPLLEARKAGEKTSAPNIKDGGIVFGYAQAYGASGTYVDFYRWEALTHVGSTFIEFDSTGNITNPSTWTGRDPILEAGGAAEAAGVKVIMVVLNENFDDAVINTVIQSAPARAILVDDIADLLQADTYSHGVSFDFEPFSWTSATRDQMDDFFLELRTELDNRGMVNHEISLYGDPTPSTTQWNAGVLANLDYLLYSGYDFASGLTPNAITEHDDATAQMDFYFDLGLDPAKFVYVISSYSRNWEATSAYGVAGTDEFAEGFTDGLYDVTLNPRFGGPFTENYVTGDEVSWYTYNDGTNDRTVTFDSPRALTTKIGSTLAYPGTGTYQGRKLGGVGFWSLMWMAETTSWDPIAGATSGKVRTYPQIYQICQELLAPPGQEDFVVAGFEGLNFRWRDPNDGPDDIGDTSSDSTRGIVSAPAGSGRPASTTNAMELSFDMDTSPGQLLFRFELLAANEAAIQNSVIDTNAVAAQFDTTTELTTSIHTSSAYANATLRMVVMDASRELEMSPAFSLNATGWRDITWDLTSGVTAYNTNEVAFVDGDGVLDTAGGGAKDIAFAGFLLETSASNTNGSVVLDEITYRHANAGGLDYKINEVRYDGATGGEFVEIYGPAGSLPAGFEVRAIDGTTGTVTTFSVSGSVPNDGGGFGYFVVGDSDVPNVDFTTGFSTGAGNLPDSNPSAVQLYNSSNGGVYDSFVYEAFGGLDELVAQSMLGVGNEGFPWFGRVATGTDSASAKHTAGRYPNGADTNVNYDDFSLMKATPGAANGVGLTAAGITTYNFTSLPSTYFTTFTSTGDGNVASGVGASPSGGNVLRVVDESGGGTVSYIGDAGLGSDGNGYQVAGEVFLPNAAAPAQAVAVGICGGQGSTFFTSSALSSGYENGYWLIYENNGTADLADGLASHAGIVHLVHASNDNQDGNPVVSLGSLAVSSGAWTTFDMTIDPSAAPASQLVAKVGGVTVYAGAIPTGGPTSGPVMFGFREFTGGTVTSVEGTWIDNLRIGPVGTVPVELDTYSVD